MSQAAEVPGGLQANCSGSGLGSHTISGTRLGVSAEGGGLEGAGGDGVLWSSPHPPSPIPLSHSFRSTRYLQLPLHLGLMALVVSKPFPVCEEGRFPSRLQIEKAGGSLPGLSLHAAQATELGMSLPLVSHSPSADTPCPGC